MNVLICAINVAKIIAMKYFNAVKATLFTSAVRRLWKQNGSKTNRGATGTLSLQFNKTCVGLNLEDNFFGSFALKETGNAESQRDQTIEILPSAFKK